jgi:hypothetical protein
MFISTYFLAKNSLPMPISTNLPTNATGPLTLIRQFVASPLDYSPTVRPDSSPQPQNPSHHRINPVSSGHMPCQNGRQWCRGQFSEALEYRNSLWNELVFDSTWDQELEGEATSLSGGALANGRGSSSAGRDMMLGGVKVQGRGVVLGGSTHRCTAPVAHRGPTHLLERVMGVGSVLRQNICFKPTLMFTSWQCIICIKYLSFILISIEQNFYYWPLNYYNVIHGWKKDK